MSAVFGSDDLLRGILLRLGYPTTLVRAALVCRRWLRLASHPAFLRRFRELHPPRPLGFYVATTRSDTNCPQFVPMQPQPPELACVRRRASFSLGAVAHGSVETSIVDCQNGAVLVVSERVGGEVVRGVHSPLYPERGMATIPLTPMSAEDDSIYRFTEIFSKECSDGVVFFWLSMQFNQQAKATVHVYLFQYGAWHIHSSATIQLPQLPHESYILLTHDKIYMLATMSSILVLDMTSSSFSTIELPDEVAHDDVHGHMMIAPADNSGVYLIHLKEFQLRVWLHTADGGSVSDFLLVDTVNLHEMSANLGILNRMAEDGHAIVNDILQMGKCALYLDLKSRELHKVYEPENGHCLVGIQPFLMIWPPIFPVFQE